MGTTGQRNGRKLYLQCSGRVHRRNDCDAPNVLYEEERWLKSIQGFRWGEYFSDSKHEAEAHDLHGQILKATGDVNAASAATAKAHEKLELAHPTETPPRVLHLWANQLESCEADQREVDHALRKLQASLASMELRRSSRDMQKDVLKRINSFIEADRSDPIKRAEFHAWLSEQDLVLVLDTSKVTGRSTCDVGIGKFEGRELVEVDHRLDDLSVLGGDVRPQDTLENVMASKPRHKGRRAKRRRTAT